MALRLSFNRTVNQIALSALEFIVCFVLAGLDFRFGWTHFPGWVTAVSCALFLIAYGLYTEVMRENAYLSRTVEIQEDQQVISTGLYRKVLEAKLPCRKQMIAKTKPY